MQPAPIETPVRTIIHDWVDYNGHLNMAYYSLLFDQALDSVFTRLELDEDYLRTGGGSAFTLEAHITYLQELLENDPVRITFQILDWDDKRMHYFEHMYHAEKGYLAATSEQMSIHVDMTTRRASPYPKNIKERIAAMAKTHASLPRPEQAGHVIGIKRKSPA